MKTNDEIIELVDTLDKIDGHSQAHSYERRNALGNLCHNIVNEIIVGRRVPVYSSERIAKIPGMLEQLVGSVIRQHQEALDDRTFLADEMEKLGSEEGRKAAGILRAMNAAAQPCFFVDTSKLSEEEISKLANLESGEVVCEPNTDYDAGYDAAFKEIAESMVANGASGVAKAEAPNDTAFVRSQIGNSEDLGGRRPLRFCRPIPHRSVTSFIQQKRLDGLKQGIGDLIRGKDVPLNVLYELAHDCWCYEEGKKD